MSDQIQEMDDSDYQAWSGHGSGGSNMAGPQSNGYTPGYASNVSDHNAGDQFYGWNPYQYNQGDFTGARAAGMQQPHSAAGQVADATAATVDPTQQNQWRNQQQGLAGVLWQQANGQGPSVAADQYTAAADQNQKQALSLMASGRGAQSGGLAGYLAAQNAGSANMSAAQGAAIGRIQEEQGARSQLGNVLDQGRQGDIGLAEANAGFQQQAGLANAGAYNNQLGQDTGAYNSMLSQYMGNQQQANMFNAGGMQQMAGLQGQGYSQMQQALLEQNMQRNQYLYGIQSQNNEANDQLTNSWLSPDGIGKIAGGVASAFAPVPK